MFHNLCQLQNLKFMFSLVTNFNFVLKAVLSITAIHEFIKFYANIAIYKLITGAFVKYLSNTILRTLKTKSVYIKSDFCMYSIG